MSTLFLTIQRIFMEYSYGDELEEMSRASSISTGDCRRPAGVAFWRAQVSFDVSFFIPLLPPLPSLSCGETT